MSSYLLKLGSPKLYNFVTPDGTDYLTANEWYYTHFVSSKITPPGEWVSGVETAPEETEEDPGGFTTNPCGNISWWDADGKNVITWEGPTGRLFTPATSGTPSGYYSAISPTNDIFGSARAVRWTTTIWDGVRQLIAPLPVIGACKQNGILIAICTLPLASPAESVRLFVYTYELEEWVQQIDYSNSELLYPATIAVANRTGTEARIIMQINPPLIGGDTNWFIGELANRELIFNLESWSVSVGRDFDPNTHPRGAYIDDGNTQWTCGDELMAVDWDSNNNLIEMWLSIHLKGQATPPNADRYFRFVGGEWDGLGITVHNFNVSQGFELMYWAYLDLRIPMIFVRQAGQFGTHRHWRLGFNDVVITEPEDDYVPLEETIPGCELIPYPGYTTTYNPWTRWINTENFGVVLGHTPFCAAINPDNQIVIDAMYRVLSFPGPIILEYRMTYISDSENPTDPALEFGLDSGAFVNPIRFGYKQ